MCCQRPAKRCWGFSGARNRAAENAPERGQRGETIASRRVSLQEKETFLKVAEQPLSCLPPASPSVFPRDAVPHSRRSLPSAVLPPGRWDSAGREYLHEAVGAGGGVWQRSGAVGHRLCRAWVLLQAAHRAEWASYGGCGTRLVPCEHSKQPRGQRLRSTVCRMSFGGLKLPSLSRPSVSLVPLPLLQSELCRLSQLSLIGDTPVPVPSPCLWPFPGLSPVASPLSWAGEPGAGRSTPRVARWGRAGRNPSVSRWQSSQGPWQGTGALTAGLCSSWAFLLQPLLVHGVIPHQCSVWNLLFLNHMRFLLASFSNHLNRMFK